MSLARQRGVALLVAIVMFAIATTVAAAITYNKAMAARRAAATFTLEQALQAGMAAEALAGIFLEKAASSNAQQTALHQDWAMPLGPIDIENTGIWIQAQLEDLSSRFNLNSLVKWSGAPNNIFEVDLRQVEVFRELLSSLDIDPRFADLMVDWLDTDINPQSTGGGEDTLYLTQVPPYRPPNTFITHTSELLALPGFGAENYALIAPHVAALPNDVPVNVCTASGLVLDITANDPQAQSVFVNANLQVNRTKSCWPTKQDFLAGIQDPNRRAAADARVDEKSSWFRLRTNIRIGTAEFVLYSVLVREGNNRVRTFQRSFGSE
jgi:general secretion pathway protein K